MESPESIVGNNVLAITFSRPKNPGQQHSSTKNALGRVSLHQAANRLLLIKNTEEEGRIGRDVLRGKKLFPERNISLHRILPEMMQLKSEMMMMVPIPNSCLVG